MDIQLMVFLNNSGKRRNNKHTQMSFSKWNTESAVQHHRKAAVGLE